MRVSDLIGSRKEVFSISEDATVLQAAQYLHEKQVRATAVVSALVEVIGVISQSDISDKVAARNDCPAWIKVSEIMSRSRITVIPDISFDESMRLMDQWGVHHLLVVDDQEEFHGMLSINDLMRAAVADEKERANILESYAFAVR
jgi:predicted transcriptional regulator